jgi:hypothetical protein
VSPDDTKGQLDSNQESNRYSEQQRLLRHDVDPAEEHALDNCHYHMRERGRRRWMGYTPTNRCAEKHLQAERWSDVCQCGKIAPIPGFQQQRKSLRDMCLPISDNIPPWDGVYVSDQIIQSKPQRTGKIHAGRKLRCVQNTEREYLSTFLQG